MSFSIDKSRWSMYRLEQAEYSAGSPTEIEIGYSMWDLPPDMWNLEKFCSQNREAIWRRECSGYTREEEKEFDSTIAREEESKSPHVRGARDKNYKKAIQNKKDSDEEEFSGLFEKSDSIFSDFRTEEDEEIADENKLIYIE